MLKKAGLNIFSRKKHSYASMILFISFIFSRLDFYVFGYSSRWKCHIRSLSKMLFTTRPLVEMCTIKETTSRTKVHYIFNTLGIDSLDSCVHSTFQFTVTISIKYLNTVAKQTISYKTLAIKSNIYFELHKLT